MSQLLPEKVLEAAFFGLNGALVSAQAPATFFFVSPVREPQYPIVPGPDLIQRPFDLVPFTVPCHIRPLLSAPTPYLNSLTSPCSPLFLCLCFPEVNTSLVAQGKTLPSHPQHRLVELVRVEVRHTSSAFLSLAWS